MVDEITPEMFSRARDVGGEAAERMDVVEIVQELEGAIENDPSARTNQSAKALGYVDELRDRLEGDGR
jgi:hypothetical protein